MWTKSKVALAAGITAAMTGGLASGAIVITSITYNDFAVPFATENPSLTTISGPHFNGSLSLSYGPNFICGTMNLQANWNYSPPLGPNETRQVSSSVIIDFTTDESITWSSPANGGPGPYGLLTASYMSGYSGGGTIGPGAHSFWGACSVGGIGGVAVNGYATLWFGIPAPSSALAILGVGLCTSIRRRR